jgi:hypothetical protein
MEQFTFVTRPYQKLQVPKNQVIWLLIGATVVTKVNCPMLKSA